MSSVLEYYKNILNEWPKEAGPKPTIAELNAVHETGTVRPGSKDAFAVAMATRDKGATQQQIRAALGNNHRNKITQLIEQEIAKRIPAAPSDGRYTVYKIVLTGRSKPARQAASAAQRKGAGQKKRDDQNSTAQDTVAEA